MRHIIVRDEDYQTLKEIREKICRSEEHLTLGQIVMRIIDYYKKAETISKTVKSSITTGINPVACD